MTALIKSIDAFCSRLNAGLAAVAVVLVAALAVPLLAAQRFLERRHAA